MVLGQGYCIMNITRQLGHWPKITWALKFNLPKEIYNQSLLYFSELVERWEAAFNDTPPHFPVYSPYVCYSCRGTNLFSSRPVQMWELDHKEGWTLKNWCIWIVVLEKTLESPLDCKIKSVSPKENQPWTFIGRIDVEAYFGHLIWRATSLEKTLMLGKRAGGKEGNRERDVWMASPTQWTWVWANSRREARTGKPGMLQFLGSQRVRHDLTTE